MWAGCTGYQTAGLHRLASESWGCATPRCSHPPECCSSASRPTSSASGQTAPDTRKYAPALGLATSLPPLRLRPPEWRKTSRRSCNWPLLLRPSRESLLPQRLLQTLGSSLLNDDTGRPNSFTVCCEAASKIANAASFYLWKPHAGRS